ISTRRLLDLLQDPRPNLRARAGRLLAARGPGVVKDLALAARSNSETARFQAAWALAAMPDKEARQALARFFGDVALNGNRFPIAVRALGQHRAREYERILRSFLKSGPDPLRLAAAEALARCGTAESVPALLDALRDNPDRVLEHALIFALHHLADVKALDKALTDPHPRVQQAALILLDQAPRPRGQLRPEAVLQRIAATDAELRWTALAI